MTDDTGTTNDENGSGIGNMCVCVCVCVFGEEGGIQIRYKYFKHKNVERICDSDYSGTALPCAA